MKEKRPYNKKSDYWKKFEPKESTHGKNMDTSSFEETQKLERALGIDRAAPFGTYDREVFLKRLQEVSYGELQKMARRVGINQFLHRVELKKALEQQFEFSNRNAQGHIKTASMKVDEFRIDPDNPKHQKLQKLLDQ